MRIILTQEKHPDKTQVISSSKRIRFVFVTKPRFSALQISTFERLAHLREGSGFESRRAPHTNISVRYAITGVQILGVVVFYP